MTLLSANLGFLWKDWPLPDAIRAAKAAGFDAVECHWPYDTPAEAVKAALEETGFKMLGLNTVKGSREGDAGLAAQPGREDEARAAIDQAFAYGRAIDAGAVHVMAGTARGQDETACMAAFAANLAYACDRAREAGVTVLIEPLNPYDNPDYLLIGFDKALGMLDRVARDELKIMFDCYHLQITDGDLLRRFRRHADVVGHVQFAGVPDRSEPDRGEVAYERLLPTIADAGFERPFGAEYKPSGDTNDTLGWMKTLR
ncbi:TIM barrel protein [Fulvimarina sp. 2208YS6-2-32]|uniref:TIM barrel protein n=1 Tax=Fulvimarina uroteuthidis TaxID=3098149 RepID=A0ABU5I028_9HYPH|nr:TIM barrel protein [Fulvimarina sp. 2208YS6-2-32]MDY8108737.1 TIM barrel protein [Fulvimarina sp. 2208YS6-2-32]